MFVDDDADDVGRFAGRQFCLAKLLHHGFAIGHLRTCLGETKLTASMWRKPSETRLREIFYFFFRGDDVGEALPGVARAFDYGDGVQVRCFLRLMAARARGLYIVLCVAGKIGWKARGNGTASRRRFAPIVPSAFGAHTTRTFRAGLRIRPYGTALLSNEMARLRMAS